MAGKREVFGCFSFSHSLNTAKLGIKTGVSLRGNLAMFMSRWPLSGQMPLCWIQTLFLVCGSWAEYVFYLCASYFEWLMFEVGLQVMHDNAAPATCNADLNILQKNETVVNANTVEESNKSNSRTIILILTTNIKYRQTCTLEFLLVSFNFYFVSRLPAGSYVRVNK